MVDERGPLIGMSVGATNFVAVTADRVVTRRPVVTLYSSRRPEVGVPSENPDLARPGVVISGFVDRVGDPVAIVADDGSTHHGEVLLADGLLALAHAALGGGPLPSALLVTHPAHWPAPTVRAMRGALEAESPCAVGLVSDAVAALAALQHNPDLPKAGIIAVCDFGGSGSSITVVDATNGYRPRGATVRHPDFSGDRIDQALLTYVLTDLERSLEGMTAIGSLAGLRRQCRSAKELLSTSAMTTLNLDLPGYAGDIALTRSDLDDVIRQPLDDFLAVVRETVERSGSQVAELAAVVASGGMAAIPAITSRLSYRLGAPVITPAQPQLTAASGALSRAGGKMPEALLSAPAVTTSNTTHPAPPLDTPPSSKVASDVEAAWYRRRLAVILGGAALVMALGGGVVMLLRPHSGGEPTAPVITRPAITTTTASTYLPAPVRTTPTTVSPTTTQPAWTPPPTYTWKPTPTYTQPPPTYTRPSTTYTRPPTTSTGPPTTEPSTPSAPESPTSHAPDVPHLPGAPNSPTENPENPASQENPLP